jgi:nucleoside-diphosphate-sugar epimerase
MTSEHTPEDQPRLCFGITGAHGYLGSSLAAFLNERGHTVVGLVRRERESTPLAEQRRYVLGEPVAAQTLDRLDVLVHCAWDFSLTTWRDIGRINVDGTKLLLDAARHNGVGRVIVISTISAFDGCKSIYGQAKLLIEKHARSSGAFVVRPGLLWGRGPGGVFGALVRVTERFPIVPLLGSGRQVQYLIHADDLGALILALAATREPARYPRTITAANPEPLTLKQILQIVATTRGQKRWFVPVPSILIWAGLRLIEAFGLSLGFRSDSIVSLNNQDPDPQFFKPSGGPGRFRSFKESYKSE